MKLRLGPFLLVKWGKRGHRFSFGGVAVSLITRHRVVSFEIHHEWRRDTNDPRNV